MKVKNLLFFDVLLVVVVVGLLFIIVRGEHNNKEENCISERTLRGCEEAGFDVERQLRTCEWALQQCDQINKDLEEKLKGEQK